VVTEQFITEKTIKPHNIYLRGIQISFSLQIRFSLSTT
jgi:hypothetical protein